MNQEQEIGKVFRLGTSQKEALRKLGIKTVLDLLYHFPARYGNTYKVENIETLQKDDESVIFGTIQKLSLGKTYLKKISISEGTVKDDTGTIKCVWYNQPYIVKMFFDGDMVRIEGKVAERKGVLYFSNPKIEKVSKIPVGVGDSLFGEMGEGHSLNPIYPESRGITSNWITHSIHKVIRSGILDKLEDPIPSDILQKYNLPSLKTALIWIHAPQKNSDADVARKRFAFEEVFVIQIRKKKEKLEYQKNKSFVIDKPDFEIDQFIKRFPFEATLGQKKAIDSILRDFRKELAMSRLLHGDVGSGKTAVAASAAFAVVTTRPKGQDYGRLQVAYMCPTEILASQHFESFIKYFSYLNINIALITSSGCKKFPSKLNPKGWTDISRTQLLKWVANGEIPIVIGTHSLIQKTVKFKNLALAIIDEQHRFGTVQRKKLVRKNSAGFEIAPHLLSMSATPIPRTLALTFYGDLDISVLDQMPMGRKRPVTEVVMPDKRDRVYEDIKKELESGRQAYVICPRIDEPDPEKELKLEVKSVKAEAKRLKKDIYPEYEIEVLHGKMNSKEKDKIMAGFSSGKINILVATSVVEVGVNVPNATIIIIEGGERFGLAQLHQLRGRVLRSEHQPYCYVFSEKASKKTAERLHAFKTAKDGFELAELDLIQRGVGELYGARQWGLSDVAMEALKNIKMIEAARNEADFIVGTDEDLSKHPLLKERVETHKEEVHFE